MIDVGPGVDGPRDPFGDVAGETAAVGAEDLHGQDLRARRGTGDPGGVVALGGDGPGDVGAVSVGVLGAADPRIDGLAVVAVQEVRAREHVAREVGVIRHHAGVDDRDRDASTLRVVSCPCGLERNLGERPLLAEARVVRRGRVHRLIDVHADQVTVGCLRFRHRRCVVRRDHRGRRDLRPPVPLLHGQERDLATLGAHFCRRGHLARLRAGFLARDRPVRRRTRGLVRTIGCVRRPGALARDRCRGWRRRRRASEARARDERRRSPTRGRAPHAADLPTSWAQRLAVGVRCRNTCRTPTGAGGDEARRSRSPACRRATCRSRPG